MNELAAKIEAILFLEPKALTVAKLARVCGVKEAEVMSAIDALEQEYQQRNGGLAVVRAGGNVQIMTAPRASAFVRQYLQDEMTGELTRPSLETLTIIVYRGPVAKSEIELIRGVNCSLILRNLLIRGLAAEVGETEIGSPIYQVTPEFLRYLGVNKVSELPDYEELNKNVHLKELLDAQQADFFRVDSDNVTE